MKKWITFILTICLAVSLFTACGEKQEAPEKTASPKATASVTAKTTESAKATPETTPTVVPTKAPDADPEADADAVPLLVGRRVRLGEYHKCRR